MGDIQFAQSVQFFAPMKTVFGIGAASHTGSEVKALGGTKALVVTDKILSDLNLLRPVLESLSASQIPYVVFDEVLPDAPVRLMLKALDILKREDCDVVIGVGGGSPMDTAKGVALMVTNGPDIRPMLGLHNVAKRGIPKIVIPTTNVAGADTGYAIVTTVDEETHEHGFIIDAFGMADLVINDPLLTLTMPPAVTADTGIDVLVTGIESVTSPDSNPFSSLYAEKIIELSAKYLPIACAKGSDLEARYHMAMGASMAGLAYMSSFLGAVHGLAYVFAGKCNLSHGRSMAPLLPSIMRYNIPGCPGKFRRVAELMGADVEGLSDFEAAEIGVQAVEELLDSIRVPRRLRDYGLAESEVPALAKAAYEDSQQLFYRTNPRDYGLADVEGIFKAAF